jgi:hypothetical protein
MITVTGKVTGLICRNDTTARVEITDQAKKVHHLRLHDNSVMIEAFQRRGQIAPSNMYGTMRYRMLCELMERSGVTITCMVNNGVITHAVVAKPGIPPYI